MKAVIRGTVYPFATLLCFGPKKDLIPFLRRHKYSPQQVKRILTRLKSDHAGHTAYLGLENLIWLPKVPFSIHDHAVMAHEIYHVAVRTIYNTGMMHNQQTEEATAYLIQWLHCEIYSAINKHEKQKKKRAK